MSEHPPGTASPTPANENGAESASVQKSAFDNLPRHYGEDGLLSDYSEHILPELRENPDIDISREDGDVINAYIEKHSPEYQHELEELLQNSLPMAPTVQEVILLPAYKEGKNMYKTLSNYLTLSNKEQFEIIILENHPEGVERDSTKEEIERFKKDHPEMQVVHLYKAFDGKGIGRVRKYLADSFLERKRKAGRDDSMLMISHDADLEGLRPGYLDAIRKRFGAEPDLDALAGPIDLPEEAYAKYPLIHASVRLLNFFHTVLRHSPSGAPRVQGANTAIRSGAYALIGGYNERAKVAEDLELGWLIEHGRKKVKGRLDFATDARVYTNPRREIESVLSDVPVIRRYDAFEANERVRDMSIDELMQEGQDFSVEEFQREVQATYLHFLKRAQTKGGWLSMEDFQKSFARAMSFLGVAYHLEGDAIVLDDISKLTKGLTEFQEKERKAA